MTTLEFLFSKVSPLLLGAAAGACSGPQAASDPLAAPVNVSSATLFAEIKTLVSNIDMVALRSETTTTYFQNLIAMAPNTPYAITDLGLRSSGLHTRLVAVTPYFRALSQAYPTLGALMDAGYTVVPDTTSLANFQKKLRQNLSEGASAMGLLPMNFDGKYTQPDGRSVVVTPSPYAPPGSRSSMERTYYDKDGHELFSCDSAVTGKDPPDPFPYVPGQGAVGTDVGVEWGQTPFRIDVTEPSQKAGIYTWQKGAKLPASGAPNAMEFLAEGLGWNWEPTIMEKINKGVDVCDAYTPPDGWVAPTPPTPLTPAETE